jgi:molecular chaperone DnaJ
MVNRLLRLGRQAIRLSWNRAGQTRMARDYYLILGVGCDATPDQIKSAYRREAKKLHPDHSGEGSEPFLAIRNAYEVLGDPERRRAYDEELARERQAQRGARRVRPEPLSPTRSPVEPLVPHQRSSAPRDTVWESSLSSFISELFGRPWDDLNAPIRPGARGGQEEFHVQVSLTREQAFRGGHIRLWVPVQIGCPACRGRGVAGLLFECPYCYGSGSLVDERPLDVAFPGGLVDGDEGRVSLSRPGMRDLSLVLHFRVNGW